MAGRVHSAAFLRGNSQNIIKGGFLNQVSGVLSESLRLLGILCKHRRDSCPFCHQLKRPLKGFVKFNEESHFQVTPVPPRPLLLSPSSVLHAGRML